MLMVTPITSWVIWTIHHCSVHLSFSIFLSSCSMWNIAMTRCISRRMRVPLWCLPCLPCLPWSASILECQPQQSTISSLFPFQVLASIQWTEFRLKLMSRRNRCIRHCYAPILYTWIHIPSSFWSWILLFQLCVTWDYRISTEGIWRTQRATSSLRRYLDLLSGYVLDDNLHLW